MTTWANAQGFPVIEAMNRQRQEYFEQAYALDARWKKQNKSISFPRVRSWLGHKILTLVTLPSNIVGTGIGLIGMFPVAWVVTAVKVGTKAVTGYKSEFTSGRPEFEACTRHSLGHIKQNICELLFELWDTITFIFNRLVAGVSQAAKGEASNAPDKPTSAPYPLNHLDEWTNKFRIDWKKAEDRQFSEIGKHLVLSIPNIAVNTLAAACGTAALMTFAALFVTKALVYAATNFDIPVQTRCAKSYYVIVATVSSAYADLRDDAYDAVAALQKTAQALRINNLLQKVKELWDYIPEAYYGSQPKSSS